MVTLTKMCVRCLIRRGRGEFCKNSRAKDGLQSWCKDCQRDYMRGRKVDPERRRLAARRSAKKFVTKRRARERVKDAVRRGDLPPVRTMACADCGATANAYDHADHNLPLDVEPVCHECHGRRSRHRGEHGRP